MARATRRPMKVTLHRPRHRRTILVSIANPWPGVPRWIELHPHTARQRLRTVPPTPFLDGGAGEQGTSAVIVDYVRRYVDGRLSRGAAEAGITAALTEWSRGTHPAPASSRA